MLSPEQREIEFTTVPPFEVLRFYHKNNMLEIMFRHPIVRNLDDLLVCIFNFPNKEFSKNKIFSSI